MTVNSDCFKGTTFGVDYLKNGIMEH